MFSSALLALAILTGAPPADAVAKKRAVELVSQLGDKDYRDREKAAKELLEMGYVAKDAVLAGQSHADGEISERCKKLYPAIWRHDLEKRVQRFLDKPEAAIPDDLPGAARWLKIAGEGKESRAFYAEMVKAHPEPLLEVELHPERLKDVYTEFVKSVYSRTIRTPGGTVASRQPLDSEVLLYLFLGAAGEVRPSVSLGVSSTYYYQFLNAPFLASKLSASPSVESMRKLYAGWLEKERYSIILRRGIDLAAQLGVKECAPIALRIASDARTTGYIRATAMLGFAKLGTKGDLKELEPFLKDKFQIANVIVNKEQGTVQMRDVTLGAAIHLAGQSLADFGFERRLPSGINSISSYTYYAFGTEEKRDAAHAKWKEWAATNLKK
ncbi:MAG: hypothetical protein EXS09_13895 [Gemmataceae bacterium]|nr:hypothetical protein [Gemmataceae bacterium]